MHVSVETSPPGSRHPIARLAAALAVVVLLAYGLTIVWLVSQETRLVFATGRAPADGRPTFPYRQLQIARADGLRQFAWTIRTDGSDARPWVLFLHGNAATIASPMNISHYGHLRALGLNVFAPEYRGYDGLDGTPSEAAVDADARAAYDFLRVHEHVSPDRLVIYGWSLGSAVAIDLAASVPEAAVILEGAPASIAAIGAIRYPYVPVRLLIRNPFDSIRKVDRVHAPVLFLHSPADTVVPIAEGRRLYAAVRSPKQFVEVRGGHIRASEVDARKFYGAIGAFLRQLPASSFQPPAHKEALPPY